MADFILNGLNSLLGPLIDSLPAWTPPSIGAVNALGYYLRVFDYFVPVYGPMSFAFGMLAWLPAFLALKFALMVYSATRGGGPS